MQTFNFSVKQFKSFDSLGFSAEEYSKLKYGSKRVARLFGTELGKDFLKHLSFNSGLNELLKGKEIVVASAPYKFIPVASTILKDYFVSIFNTKWVENEASLQDLKVFRGHSYNDDYGSMTQEQRDAVIGSDNFYIDKEFIKGKVLFFIDDIKITGSHERRIKSLLESVGFEGTVVFLYYAMYEGTGHPNIENQLNYGFVKQGKDDLLKINYIIQNDEFIFNTRVTKYILAANHKVFCNFIDYQTKTFRNTLLTYLCGNEYNRLEEFKENINYLKTKI